MRRCRRYQQLRGLKLTCHLRARGIEVLEVERPKHMRRGSRRNLEKSDPSDAERAVLVGEASGVPKIGDERVEMIRALRAARRSAMKARTRPLERAPGLARDGIR